VLVVRAWPDHPPAGRPHIVDGWPRVPVDDYDYRALASVGENVISMDWDTACSAEDLRHFAAQAAEQPAEILVAPVRTYYGPTPGQWNLATIDGTILPTGAPVADVFGFGLVYLPRARHAAFTAANPGARLIDPVFSSWHYETTGRGVRVCWSVRPVHLHYPDAISGRLTMGEARAA
jgi:hypothetical protein